MDDQNTQPTVTPEAANPPQALQSVPTVAANPPEKPKLDISDEAAIALLKMHNLEAAGPKKALPHKKLLIATAGLIVLAILVSYLMGAFKPGSVPSSTGLTNQSSNSSSGNDTSNQINQDVKTCSDPVKAATVC